MHFPAGLRDRLHQIGCVQEQVLAAKIRLAAETRAKSQRSVARNRHGHFEIATAEQKWAFEHDRRAMGIVLHKSRQALNR